MAHFAKLLTAAAACGLFVFDGRCPAAGPDPAHPASRGEVRVTVDPRIEMLVAVELFGGYEDLGLLTPYDVAYKREVQEYFAPYQDHQAVRLFREMSDNGFRYSAPVEAMLALDGPPDFAERAAPTALAVMQARGADNVREFQAAMRRFAADSKFMAFYDAHRPFYDALTSQVREAVDLPGALAALESYMGMSQPTYGLILSPLLQPGGYGPRVDDGKGGWVMYSIIGPAAVKDAAPVFASGSLLQSTAWHEFGHSFVNPLTEKHLSEFTPNKRLMSALYERGYLKGAEGYAAGIDPDLLRRECIDEHVNRAIDARITLMHVSQEAANMQLRSDAVNGFLFVRPIYDLLARYESNRDKYKTIEDFYPEIIALFARLPERGKP